MDDPNADTEWNDILRAKGILPPKPKELEITEEEMIDMIEETIRAKSGVKKMDDMTLDELDELEDDEDEMVLERYRQQRLAELREKAAKAKFGTVQEISKPEYVQEVNQAGAGVWVVVHLYSNSVQQSAIISHYLPAIAAKFPATKFVCIQSTRCIENYPDKNLPTVFVYRDAELKASLIGPAAWSGVTSAEGIELELAKTGAVESNIEDETRHRRADMDVLGKQIRQQREAASDDDDW